VRLAFLITTITFLIAAGAALASCTEHGQGGAVVCRHNGETFFPGDFFPAGDGCNFCDCTAEGGVGRVTCGNDSCGDGGVRDGGSGLCAPASEFGCAGPFCEGICCGQGESCELGQCTCGGGPACFDGNACAPAGPIGGSDACGSVCCGGSNGPCPL
jgi:hypothetical protein